MAKERDKLYCAIGYSEKGKVADYPKQVRFLFVCEGVFSEHLLLGDGAILNQINMIGFVRPITGMSKREAVYFTWC